MSLRLRLTLWYAGLTSVIVIAIALLAYGAHGRTQYLDVDRALVEEAGYLASVVEITSDSISPSNPDPVDDFQTFVRLYDRTGEPVSQPSFVANDPPLNAIETLRSNDGAAYDAALRWLPGGNVSARGAFATRRSGDHRVRVYAEEVLGPAGRTGYVQTWTSLDGIDRSIARFRFLMFGGAMVAAIAVSLGGLAISGLALRPLSALIQTAAATSQSGRFDRRVPALDRGDELGTLTSLFNQMLDALEESYRAQQQFVADAAHELRAPLTVIGGNAELLTSVKEMSEADRREAMQDLQQESLRLSRLAEELLILAQSDAGLRLEMRPVELDSLLLQTIAHFRRETDASRVSVSEIVPVVIDGNADRLRQLITILLDNALKYSTGAEDEVFVSTRQRGESVELEVRDRGIGISAEAIPHIFERFYRADRARGRDPGGSGLGLSIAHWIVSQHEADIQVFSEPGVGTTFTVRFQASTAATAAPEHVPPATGLARSEPVEPSSEEGRIPA